MAKKHRDDSTNDIHDEGSHKPSFRTAEQRLKNLIDLSLDLYWEEDENYRFIYYRHRHLGSSEEGDPLSMLGKTPWELGGVPVEDGGDWTNHKTVRESRRPFMDFLYQRIDAAGEVQYINISGIPLFNEDGRFLGYSGISRDVTEEVKTDRLLALERSVLRILTGAVKIDDALREAICAICESEGWEAGNYWLLDKQAGLLRHDVGWSNQRTETISWIMGQAENMVFEPGSGLPGWVLQAREPLWIPDTRKDERIERTDITELTGWQSILLFPVISSGEPIGVLDFYAPYIPEPNERLLRVLRLLGAEIGNYYQRAVVVEQLRESEERFRSLTELSSDWYWEQDSELRFTRFEGQDSPVLRAMQRDMIGKRAWESDIEYLDEDGKEADPVKPVMEKHESFRDVIRHRRFSDGAELYLSVSGEPVYDDEGNFRGYRGITRNVTEAKLAEKKIQFMATHDSLTGLPNRTMFRELLRNTIAAAKRYDRRFAVIFIDLDRFKNINDTLGHEAGDIFLKEISERLKNCLRSSDVPARLGGDEFVVLLQEAGGKEQAAAAARNLLSAALQPVEVHGQECLATASLGIALYPDHGRDEDTLLKNADTAMYAVKEAGKNNYQFYT